MTEYAKNFPDYAQSSFERLCDLRNLTRNKASHDREGWDYLVEFARERIPSLPHDQQPGNATARVQIKSKTGGKPSTNVKLSNALRFANESDPCFLVLFWRSKDHSVERIFARHFHKDLMEAALRRARQANRDGQTQINRIRLPISFTDQDDHTDDLIVWIQSVADADPHDYSAEKSELVRSLGFGQDAFVGTISVPYEQIQNLIDASVGLEAIPPKMTVSVENKRFDIPATIFSGTPEVARISAHPKPAKLIFRSPGDRVAEFVGELRAFGIPDLPIETVRARFASPCINATLHGPALKIDYQFTASDPHSWRLIRNLIAFLVMSKERMTVTLLVEGMPPLETRSDPIDVVGREKFEWLDWVLNGLAPCCIINEEIILKVADIVEARSAVGSFVRAGLPVKTKLSFAADRQLSLGVVQGLMGYRIARIGNLSFFSISRRATLHQGTSDVRHEFEFDEPVELDAGILEMAEEDAIEFVQTRLKGFVDRVGRRVILLNGGDILAALHGDSPNIDIVVPSCAET